MRDRVSVVCKCEDSVACTGIGVQSMITDDAFNGGLCIDLIVTRLVVVGTHSSVQTRSAPPAVPTLCEPFNIETLSRRVEISYHVMNEEKAYDINQIQCSTVHSLSYFLSPWILFSLWFLFPTFKFLVLFKFLGRFFLVGNMPTFFGDEFFQK